MDSAVETPETVDVVMPAYNEEEAIELAVIEVLESIVLKLPGSRLIAVDDGSTDSTRDILYALSEKYKELKVISQTNAGHGPALITGMALSSAPWIFLIDSDRQQDAEDFWNLWNVRDENDLVMGVRQGRDDGKGRAVISAGLRQLGLILFGARLSDPQRAIQAGVPAFVGGGRTHNRPLLPDPLGGVGPHSLPPQLCHRRGAHQPPGPPGRQDHAYRLAPAPPVPAGGPPTLAAAAGRLTNMVTSLR